MSATPFPQSDPAESEGSPAGRAGNGAAPAPPPSHSGSSADAPAARRLGSFRIVRRIGAGGMGVVHEAVHEPTGRPAAVKEIAGDNLRDIDFKRFEREGAILRQFKHPNIVRFYAWGKSQGTWYLAMELVDGLTLDKYIERRGGTLPWKDACLVASQLCQALQYAHERKVVHRDLKPSNLMITKSGRLKLTDFGIAKNIDATGLTATGRTVGTAHYMAPEQISDTNLVSHKTDLYAVGCVLFQMLTGKPPFEGPTFVSLMHMHINDEPPRAGDREEIPPLLDDLVAQLLRKDPSKRPWDAQAVALRLDEIRQSDWKPVQRNPIPVGGYTGSAAYDSRFVESDSDASRSGGGKSKAKGKSKGGGFPVGSETLGVLGLVAALILGVAFVIWYATAKTSNATLLARVERAMASDDPYTRRGAEKDLRELLGRDSTTDEDRARLRQWLDVIALDRAEARAPKLVSKIRALPPENDAEKLYAETHLKAGALESALQFRRAAALWREMARTLAADPESVGWKRLADKAADRLDAEVETRRDAIRAEMKLTSDMLLKGEPNALQTATAVWTRLLERYGDYPDLRPDLLAGPVARLLEYERPVPEGWRTP